MKIWIDLANSPHVIFFLPIITALKARGCEIEITMRDFAQTVGLAKKFNLPGEVIGEHGGKSRIKKVLNLFQRSRQLKQFSQGKKIDIAVSHNSYTHIVTARLSGIRTVTLMDYEGQPANHIAFRLAHKIIVPDSFPEADLRRLGASPRKVNRYAGFKEQVYLSDFEPNPNFIAELREACNLPTHWELQNTVLAVVRTPPTMAAYHLFENPLFDVLMNRLDQMDQVTTVVLPRIQEQGDMLRKVYQKILIPNKPLNGNDLMYYADLVISAGGTMNREAAILGTPAYTIFGGKLPAVDSALIQQGRMYRLAQEKDVEKVPIVKKIPGKTLRNPGLCEEIIQKILS